MANVQGQIEMEARQNSEGGGSEENAPKGATPQSLQGQDGEQQNHHQNQNERQGGGGGRGQGNRGRRGGGGPGFNPNRGGRGGFNRGRGGNQGHGGGRGGGQPNFGGQFGGPRGFGGQGQGGMQERKPPGLMREEEFGGPQDNVPAIPLSEKKYTGRCRLFLGNLPNEMTEDDFKEFFTPHGEFTEVFVNPSKGFGFIRMDTRANSEKAKAAIDGVNHKGRTLRCRFATHGAALKVLHLSPHVTNEKLEEAFSHFGELERAVVIVDDRGKSTGEGIVEFARKSGFNAAMKRINEGVFLLGANPKPIVVEPYEPKDDNDGLQDRFTSKSNEFIKEREQPPRFCPQGSFEFEIGNKWKELYQNFRKQEENLKRQFDEAALKLEFEMENAAMEHQAQMLRQDLMRKQEELRMLEEQQQMEMQRRLEQRRQMDEQQRRQEDDIRQRGPGPQHIFKQERNMNMGGNERGGMGGGSAPPMQPPPAPPANLGIEQERRNMGRGQRMNDMSDGNMMGNGQQSMAPSFQERSGGMPPSLLGAGSLMGIPPPGRLGNGGGGGGAPRQDQRRVESRRGPPGPGQDDFFENKRQRRF